MTPEGNGRQTRQASRKSEDLYQLLAENSTDMISKHSPEGVYTYASPACRSLLGYEPEELVGRSAYEFFHPEDLERISDTHSAILERPEVYTVSYRIRRKDGSCTWFETTSRTVRDPETDEVLEIIAVSRDITERKRAEEAYRESSRKIENILESITEEFFAVDRQWRYTYINERALRRMRRTKGEQLTREELLGKNAWELYPEFVDSVFYRELHRALREQKTVHFEGYSEPSDRWYETHAYPSEEGLSVYSKDVSERKRAEERLRKSEERLRRAVEIDTVGVIFFKTDGSITDANDAFLRMSGYCREDLAEGLVRWDEMTPPEWMPHSLKAVEELRSTGRTVPYEKEYVRKDGSRWWALFAATRLDEVEGVEFIVDITESKQAEADLRESNERTTDILESITDAFFAVDSGWRLTYLNRQAERLLQRGREELLGRCMWDEFPEAVGSRFYEKYHEAVESGTPVHFEEFYEPLDYWAEVHAYPSREGLAVYFRDVTERKRAREALQESEQRLRAIFDNTLDAILIANDDREYTEANPAACKLLGIARDELLGSRLEDFVPEAERETVRRAWYEFLEKGRMEGEFRLRRTDGAIRVAEFKAKADFLPGRHLSVLRDVTERKRAEEALERTLEARTQFMADVSHELRTPLTVIRGNAEVGLEIGRESVRGEVLEEIVREAGSMSRMVEDLLFLARSDSDSLPLDKETLPVARFVSGLVERTETLARKHDTSLQVALRGEGHLECDVQRIEQAVLILVDNAVRYGLPREPVTLSSSTRQDELLIEIADRGPGIPPEELPHIFERFYRGVGSSEKPGSGLGLAIAKTIVEAHKGSVVAESRVGEGTRMSLRLPLANGL